MHLRGKELESLRKSLGPIKLMLQGRLRAEQELNIILEGKEEMTRSWVNVYLSSKLGHLRVKGHALIITSTSINWILWSLIFISILCQHFLKAMRNQTRILNRSDSHFFLKVTHAFKKANFDRKENVTYVKLKEGNWVGGRRLF